MQNKKTKIVVIDDDPTGSQTVHSCLLLTRWNIPTLCEALTDEAPLFFVLSNTRGMNEEHAQHVTRDICRHLRQALTELQDVAPAILVVSRSDSTLRGHYPVETDVIAEELGPFDAHFLVPAFFEGGRTTRDSIHYLKVNGQDVPVHETEFAKDSVFGYRNSYLPAYVEEKTKGRIKAAQVQRFLLADIRNTILPRLLTLKNNACCVVDAESPADLNHFAGEIIRASQQGKKFLFRSAASLLTSLADLPPQPIPAEQMSRYVRDARAGAIIVGSHVAKTTLQLQLLLQEPAVVPIEINVDDITHHAPRLLTAITDKAADAHRQWQTPVIYTSRTEKRFPTLQERLAFGESVSAFLMEIVRHLPPSLGFLISKGGITSNDVLSSGLALRTARVLGQISPGCSVVKCAATHPRYPDMPVVIFPGNVGDENALRKVYQWLTH